VRFVPTLPLCLALSLVLQAHGALAQQASEEDELSLVYGDKASISIATGSTQSLRRAPAVASVITAQDIAAMGATDLDHIMETIPGMHVNRSANQYSPLYVVRGIFSQFAPQLLVLQNGIPISSIYLSNKGNVWAGYPVEHIARIEVIRGPGSALYGSDAYAGVVNIITKTATDTPGTEVGLRAGSFSTRDGWVQHGGTWGAAAIAAYVRVGATDGFRRIIGADAQSRNDTVFGTKVSLAPGPVNLGNDAVDGNLDISVDKWRFRAGYKLRDNVQTGAGVASELDPRGRSRSERITTDLSWTDQQIASDWSVGAMLSTLYYNQLTPVDYQLLPPGLTFPTGPFPNGMRGGPDFWEQSVRLSAYAGYAGFKGHHLRAGVGHDDLDLYRIGENRNFTYAPSGLPIPQPGIVDYSQTDPYLLTSRRKVDHLYLQDEWSFAPDWTLTAGVRHDRYSDFGGTTNPRMALVWDASLDLTVKLLYGRAFRAPSFVEFYGRSNPVAIGNPLLKPETNNTLEGVLSWQARADTQLNLTLYRYGMTSIIRTVPNAVAGTGATYKNTGDQNGHGFEFEATMHASGNLQLMASYSWQKSTDKASGKDAGYAPRHHLYSRADWRFSDGYSSSAQVNWVADRKRAPGDLRKPIDDYTTLDLTLRTTRRHGQWGFSATLRNVFDADVREPSLGPGLQLPFDLPMAPRALSVQATYQL
jgi:outer membrane receptor for ferrienterochelin and colicin